MRRITKFLSLGLALTVAMAIMGWTAGAQAQTPQANIGVFDLQKCLNDSKKGKQARTNLENQFKKMQTDLKSKEDEIAKLSSELRKMVETKSGNQDAMRKKDEDLKKKVNAYQEQLNKYNDDMRKQEENSLKPLVDKAVAAAGDLGRQRGYMLVLEVQQAGVIYALDGMDLTPEIIKVVDK
jgi:outer membrane protein